MPSHPLPRQPGRSSERRAAGVSREKKPPLTEQLTEQEIREAFANGVISEP
jgi:hypothetical protein